MRPFNIDDLCPPAHVALLRRSISAQPGAQYFGSGADADRSATHTEDVGVIVLSAHAGTVRISAQSGMHTLDLIGRNTHPDASAAHEHSSVGVAAGHGARNLFGDVRVVGLSGRAEIQDLDPARFEVLSNGAKNLHAGVIASNRYLHCFPNNLNINSLAQGSLDRGGLNRARPQQSGRTDR
jgi:hypothetical protein